MGKRRSKNGFEYECEKHFFGNWLVVWRFRPQNEEIFIQYDCGENKTLQKDMEALVSSPERAQEYYYRRLAWLSNVEAAQLELKQAEARYAHVTSPDFDLRSNNPNKEARAYKNADNQLNSAQRRLETATRYSEILNNKSEQAEDSLGERADKGYIRS